MKSEEAEGGILRQDQPKTQKMARARTQTAHAAEETQNQTANPKQEQKTREIQKGGGEKEMKTKGEE